MLTVPSKKDQSPSSTVAKYLKFSQAGLQFFVSVALPTGVGIWADQRLATGALLTILGLALGFGTGLYSLYHDIYVSEDSSERRRRSGKDDAEGGGKAAP